MPPTAPTAAKRPIGANQTTESRKISLARAGRPLRILMLDDEDTVRYIIGIFLSKWFEDYTILECCDGDQAVRCIERQTPDIMITDINHPGMRLDEMLRKLGLGAAQFPILIQSAFAEAVPNFKAELEHSFPHLHCEVISKPYPLEALRDSFLELLWQPKFPPNLKPISLAGATGGARIVLLDSNPESREVMKRGLRRCFEGFSIHECGDGAAAWDSISSLSPSLVITDYHHKGLCVDELMQRLALQRPRPPILIVLDRDAEDTPSIRWLQSIARFNVQFMNKQDLIDELQAKVLACLATPPRTVPPKLSWSYALKSKFQKWL